jgi:hypothetical protein
LLCVSRESGIEFRPESGSFRSLDPRRHQIYHIRPFQISSAPSSHFYYSQRRDPRLILACIGRQPHRLLVLGVFVMFFENSISSGFVCNRRIVEFGSSKLVYSNIEFLGHSIPSPFFLSRSSIQDSDSYSSVRATFEVEVVLHVIEAQEILRVGSLFKTGEEDRLGKIGKVPI